MSVDNPYVGLRPFEAEESILFFGRTEQVAELLERLSKRRFVAIVGVSGCGKSSLVRAGLIPALKAGYLVEGSDKWHVAIMKPGQNPLRNLVSALLETGGEQPPAEKVDAVLKGIESAGIDALLDAFTPELRASGANLFLLADQFEELFRYARDGNTQQKNDAFEFVNMLLELAVQDTFPVYVSLTMRADFLGDCARFTGLPEAMNTSQYLVPRLTRQQLRTAIAAPARLYRGEVTPELTSLLLNELGNNEDELPLLQHVLMRMWDSAAGDEKTVLTAENYKAVGGLKEALSRHADEALAELDTKGKAIAKKLFQALTEVDEKGRKTRRPTRLTEILQLTGSTENELLTIIEQFIKDGRCFLVKSSGNPAEMMLDISHESIIRQWTTLAGWIDEEAAAARQYSDIAEAQQINEEGRRGLMGKVELETADKWWRAFKPTAEWARRYGGRYDACKRYVDLSATAIRRQVRNSRIIITSIIIGLVIVGVVINYLRSQADRQYRAFWMHAQAREVLDKDPTVALRLEEAANNVYPDTIFQRALDKIYSENLFYKVLFKDSGVVYMADISADDQRIVTVADNMMVRLWSAEGKVLHTFPIKDNLSEVSSIAISKDGSIVAVGYVDGIINIFDSSGKSLRVCYASTPRMGKSGPELYYDNTIVHLIINDNSSRVGSLTAEGVGNVWRVHAKDSVTLSGNAQPFSHLIFTADTVVTRQYKYSSEGYSNYCTTKLFDSLGKAIPTQMDFSNLPKVYEKTNNSGQLNSIPLQILNNGRFDSIDLRKALLPFCARVNGIKYQEADYTGLSFGDFNFLRYTKSNTALLSFRRSDSSICFHNVRGNLATACQYEMRTERKWNPTIDFQDGYVVSYRKNGYGDSAMVFDQQLRPARVKFFVGSRSSCYSLTGQKMLKSGRSIVDLGGQVIATLSPPVVNKEESYPSKAVFSDNGAYLFVAWRGGVLNIYDANGRTIATKEHTGEISDALYSVMYKTFYCIDTGHLYSFENDGTLKSINVRVSEGVKIAVNGDLLTYVASDGKVTTLKLPELKTVRSFNTKYGNIPCMAISPDSKSIAFGTQDGTIYLTDRLGNPIHKYTEISDRVSSLMFTKDSKRLISATSAGTISLWEVPTQNAMEFLKTDKIEPLTAEQKKAYNIK